MFAKTVVAGLAFDLLKRAVGIPPDCDVMASFSLIRFFACENCDIRVVAGLEIEKNVDIPANYDIIASFLLF